MVFVPQLGSTNSIQFPKSKPEYEGYLKEEGLELLGWIHSQSQDFDYMTSYDITTQSRMFEHYDPRFIDMTASYTPGSVTLAAFELSERGFEWGKSNKDMMSDSPEGFEKSFSKKSQLIMSDKILGTYMVPEDEICSWVLSSIQTICTI